MNDDVAREYRAALAEIRQHYRTGQLPCPELHAWARVLFRMLTRDEQQHDERKVDS